MDAFPRHHIEPGVPTGERSLQKCAQFVYIEIAIPKNLLHQARANRYSLDALAPQYALRLNDVESDGFHGLAEPRNRSSQELGSARSR